jgi:hypothetical protein
MSEVTPARAALHDLIATMQAQANWYERVKHRDATDEELRQMDKLDERQAALERQLQQEVKDKLGIDYATLWHAVTPSGPIPKLPG